MYDGLKSAGTDVANWMNGAGNEIKDGLNSVGDTLSNAWESGTSAIGSVFSGWKKRKRALQSQVYLGFMNTLIVHRVVMFEES